MKLEVLYLLASIPALYVLFIVWDLTRAAASIRKMLSPGKYRRSKIKFPKTTFVGRSLADLADNISLKISSLNMQVEDDKTEVVANTVKSKQSETGDFFANVATSAMSKVRSEIAVIMTAREGSTIPPRINVCLSRSGESITQKFSSFITDFYSPYFLNNDKALLGLRDGLESKTVSADFYVFGLRYVIATPFRYKDSDGNEIKGIFWLGYKNGTEPQASEMVLTSNLCAKIESEFASQILIQELSSKVKEEKIINKQHSDFLAHASHDIRSPLNNIRSILNLIQLDTKNGEHAEMIEVAIGNCSDMEEIVNSILDFSKFQAGQLVQRKETFDIHSLAREVVNNQRVVAKLKNLDLSLNFDADSDILVDVDKRQLRRVLNNLLSNAVKYTRQGSIAVKVSHNGLGGCTIAVEDTGIGMSEEQLRILFTPFSRFHQTEADGIGLGLTLTKILVELNDGKINVQSGINKGSCFEVSFDCQVVPRDVMGILEEKLVPNKPPSLEVVVLDDDAMAVESLSNHLTRQGYTVTKCYNVSDAIGFINFSSPDVLVTDWNMPDGGARRLLNYMQKHGISTKVCVISGSEEENLHSEMKWLGVDLIQPKNGEHEGLNKWLEAISETKVKQHTADHKSLVA